ncbi:hypothetical protein D3C75_1014510 [compost metagenome]
MQPLHLALLPGVTAGHSPITVEQHPVAVIAHGRDSEEFADQRRHALNVGHEYSGACFQVALGLLGQCRLDQLGTVHIARHQQYLRVGSKAVGLVVLVEQCERGKLVALLQGVGQQRQQAEHHYSGISHQGHPQ